MSSFSNDMQPETESPQRFANDQLFEDEYNKLFAVQASLKNKLAPLFREHRRLRAILLRVPESSISIDDIDVRGHIHKPPPNMHDFLRWRPLANSSSDENEYKPINLKLRNKLRLLHAMEFDICSMEMEIGELEWRNRVLRDRLRTTERTRRNATVVIIDLEDEPEDEPMKSAQSVEDHRETSREMSKMNGEESTDEQGTENMREKYKTTVEERTDEENNVEHYMMAAEA
ncbi:MAG: hypothetical protein Q9211_005764 [Gyalolechia sp. 1 TL-2023]